jgi:hypothetical protein
MITKITLSLIGILLALILISGIDAMNEREPGQAPIDQNEDPSPDGKGHGHNPRVPIDDYVWVLGVGAIGYGIYIIKKSKKININN